MGYHYSTLDYIQVSETIATDTSVAVLPGAAEAMSAQSLAVDGHVSVVVSPAAAVAASPAISIEGNALVPVAPASMGAGSGSVFAGVYVIATVSPTAAVAVTPPTIGPIEVVLPRVAIAATPLITVSAHTTIAPIAPAAGTAFSGTVSAFVITDPHPTTGISISVVPGYVEVGGGSEMLPDTFTIDFTRTLTLFTFYITGSSGNSNVQIPISSFQLVLYANRNAYLEVSIPGMSWVDAIAARSDGNLSLKMAYAAISTLETLQEEQVVAVPMETIDMHRGAAKQAITLSGHETDSQAATRQSNPKTITLTDGWYNYKRTSGDQITVRLVRPHIYLQAGDTIVDDDGEFTVDRITWVKSESYHHMELTGAST